MGVVSLHIEGVGENDKIRRIAVFRVPDDAAKVAHLLANAVEGRLLKPCLGDPKRKRSPELCRKSPSPNLVRFARMDVLAEPRPFNEEESL